MENGANRYKVEEKHAREVIKACEICTDLIINHSSQQNGLSIIRVEEIVEAILQIEIKHRQNLLHLRLARAGLSKRES
jgi:hypothetical protein